MRKIWSSYSQSFRTFRLHLVGVFLDTLMCSRKLHWSRLPIKQKWFSFTTSTRSPWLNKLTTKHMDCNWSTCEGDWSGSSSEKHNRLCTGILGFRLMFYALSDTSGSGKEIGRWDVATKKLRNISMKRWRESFHRKPLPDLVHSQVKLVDCPMDLKQTTCRNRTVSLNFRFITKVRWK